MRIRVELTAIVELDTSIDPMFKGEDMTIVRAKVNNALLTTNYVHDFIATKGIQLFSKVEKV